MHDHAIWQYLHILLFVYWLGADLGVFLASRYIARADLGLEERLRFLELTLSIDLGPRTALILIIPVGFTLALDLGLAAFVSGWLHLIWIAALAWLAIAWTLHLRARTPVAARLQPVDRAVRIAVAAGFLGVGVASFVSGSPLPARWLAAKFVLFGVVVVLGLLLRRIIVEWVEGFRELREAATRAAGNARIERSHCQATRLALALWACVAVIALLGVAKPA